ncbi:hypothetical protein OKW43_007682 [Paraburkholderia sp. WC7.3g]
MKKIAAMLWNSVQHRASWSSGQPDRFVWRAALKPARRYFEKAIDQNGVPETVTKSGANLAGLHAVNAERETPIKIRQVKAV